MGHEIWTTFRDFYSVFHEINNVYNKHAIIKGFTPVRCVFN